MKYLSKKQQKNIEMRLSHLEKNDYELSALQNGEVMGTANFAIVSKDRKVWLRKIETRQEFQNMGVGQALLDVLEYFTIQNGLKHIEGKFYPDNEFARPFYLKNGYDIYKEDYETYVEKFLNPSAVLSEKEDRILGYEVLDCKDDMEM